MHRFGPTTVQLVAEPLAGVTENVQPVAATNAFDTVKSEALKEVPLMMRAPVVGALFDAYSRIAEEARAPHIPCAAAVTPRPTK